MGSNWVTKHAMPFVSTFLHSQKFSSLCWNMEVVSHVVATFTRVLQEVCHLNTVAIHFPENSCHMKLQNIPRYLVVD